MSFYRKKPVLIEAIQWDGSSEKADEIYKWNGNELWLINYEREIKIPTLEGTMIASVGDYIVKGIQGEFYPCKSDIFEATYEKVT